MKIIVKKEMNLFLEILRLNRNLEKINYEIKSLRNKDDRFRRKLEEHFKSLDVYNHFEIYYK